MRVLVTGATGFIGRHLVPRLIAKDHAVGVLVRDPAKAASLDATVTVHVGDLFDAGSVRAAMRGYDAVIHLAALASPGSRAAHLAISGDGTRTVAAAAAAAGVQRFVHMSTMAVYRDLIGRRHETAPLGPSHAYGLGKLRGERAVELVAKASGLPYVILRPNCVYGASRAANDWTGIFHRLLRRAPVLPLPLGGYFGLGMIHVDTLADACIASLTTGGHHAAYNVSDAGNVRAIEIVQAYRDAVGRAPTVLSVPGGVLDLLTWLPAVLRGAAPLGSRLRQGIVADTTAASRHLDFDPGAHDFLDTFRDVLIHEPPAAVPVLS